MSYDKLHMSLYMNRVARSGELSELASSNMGKKKNFNFIVIKLIVIKFSVTLLITAFAAVSSLFNIAYALKLEKSLEPKPISATPTKVISNIMNQQHIMNLQKATEPAPTEATELSSLGPPPKAEKIPYIMRNHNDERIDDYAWMRDKAWPKVEDPKILAYLTAENNYFDAFMKQHQIKLDNLYQEIIARIQLEDSSVPLQKDDYFYYNRTEKSSDYSIYCRRKGTLQAPEEILLDANELAKKFKFFSIDALRVSDDHQKLLYSIDTTGADRFTVYVKDLNTGQTLSDAVDNTLGSVFWNREGTGFFYAKLSDNWRTEEIYYHRLGDNKANDTLIYKEKDPLFWLGLDQTGSKRFIVIESESKDSSEARVIDLDDPQNKEISTSPNKERKFKVQLIQARKNDHRYTVDHHGTLFYILTNDKGRNFRLVTTPLDATDDSHWQELIPHDPKIYLNDFDLYQNDLVLTSSENGLPQIKVLRINSKTSLPILKNIVSKDIKGIQFPDPSYDASQSYTTFDAKGFRIDYSSLVSPDSVLEYDFESGNLKTLKVREVLGGYQKDLYQAERVFATSVDGTKVPISLVYKKSLFKKDGSNPLYLYGYGSYGSGIAPNFKSQVLSLLDRGFVYAIAHIRGGDDMGYEWYENAKFLKKRNTFDDFLSAASYLAQEKYTQEGNISIVGRSAGGMLIGVCINEKPQLFKAAIADVPFVDVLNTMLDETLPLTPSEFKEWGNPKSAEYYYYMKSYSPYDNVKRQAYPALLVWAGLNDPRVTYWEPAKWVAKLREMKTNDNLILFHTNMDAGHAGSSGRFDQYKEVAKEYLFLLLMHQVI